MSRLWGHSTTGICSLSASHRDRVYDVMELHYLSESNLRSTSANAVHVMKMCHAFAQEGLDVTLHAVGEGAQSEAHLRYGTCGFSIRLHQVASIWLVRMLLVLKSKCQGLPIGQIPHLIFGLMHLRNHIALPDLLYARNINWLWACTLGRRIPFVVECHRPPANRLEAWILRALLGHPSLRKVVVISQALQRIFLQRFPRLRSQDIMALHDGADPVCDAGSIEGDDTFRVGYVGGLYPGRGIEMICALAQREPKIEFHIVGGTFDDIQHWRNQISAANVIFHGHVPHSVLSDFYRQFTVVLAPYQQKVAIHGGTGNTSGFMSPLKIFEYMAWGKAMIVSDFPVLREVLREGENALLVAPDDVNGWHEALKRLRNDSKLVHQMGGTAKIDLEARYSWSVRTKSILKHMQVSQNAVA